MIENRLKELMQAAGKTQQQVASDLGLTRQRLNFYATGKREPDNEMLTMLSRYFSVSTDYLLGLTDKKNKPVTDIGDELSEEDKEYIKKIKSLNEDQQKLLNIFLNGLKEN